ncbi:aspartyl protease family protein [Flavobacterium tibetense]|uniref:PDZ domain-containing protein n=1 Tax=Flavobacterium tibetense TaxID=2233533 RepID=A0A365NZL2_9FLAO|nr:aspartyl protease family protein [Flavobacterium tibetense]RBA27660.1 hypothetical protein DPN68_10715 [Flavobacterium tibetense]
MLRLLFAIVALFITTNFFAQNSVYWNSKKDKIKIPFELSHNLIIVDANFNGINLKMILDSGSDQNLLFSVPEKDSIYLENAEYIKIKGVGKDTLMEAYFAKSNTLKIKEYTDTNFDILIVPNQEINIVNVTGVQINGILGASFFENFLVEINYATKKIYLHQNSGVLTRKSKKYSNETITIQNRKPYVDLPILLNERKYIFKLLVDTGLSDGLWLFENDSIQCKTNYFDDTLGFGLSGLISGKRSKVNEIKLSNYVFQNALVSYPEIVFFKGIKVASGRNGSLGGQLLKRFNWFFDYKNNQVYFKRNKLFDSPFEYNMSGIEIQHKGSEWVKYEVNAIDRKSNEVDKVTNFYNKVVNYKYELKPIYEIYALRENSPAYYAGLRQGDIVLKINGSKTSNLKIDYFNDLFTSEEGKLITIEVNRKGKILKFKFKLEKIL